MRRDPDKLRAWQRRSRSRLARTGRPGRSKGVRKSNPERKAKLHAKHYGPYAHYIRSRPCDTCSRGLPVCAAHVDSKGSGQGGYEANLLTMCVSVPGLGEEGCHDEQHRIGWPAFERKRGLDAAAKAREIYEDWLARGKPATAQRQGGTEGRNRWQ